MLGEAAGPVDDDLIGFRAAEALADEVLDVARRTLVPEGDSDDDLPDPIVPVHHDLRLDVDTPAAVRIGQRGVIEGTAEALREVVVDGEEAVAERLLPGGALGVAEEDALVAPAVAADASGDVRGLLADVHRYLEVGTANGIPLPP